MFNRPDQSKDNPTSHRILSDFTKINLVFWVVIALINYFQDVYLLSVQENDNAWTFAAIFSFDWPLWAALTPFIVKLAIRYPMTWSSMYKTLSRQFALATFFVALHAVVEFLIIGFLISDLLAHHAEDVYLPAYFMTSIHSRYIVYFLIVGGVQRFELYYQNQQAEVQTSRLKEQLSAAQLETLRIQLQPHFLFNTHHTISGLILKNENSRAIQMLTRLSDLLRKSLEKSKTDFIPLYQELEMISSYMEIQKVRFQDRLVFSLVIDPDANNVLVPSFFLQPLIENAVIHGIEPSSDKGEIRLSITKTSENRLSIILEDNGVGIDSIPEEGIGLSNTKQRLNQLYKGQYLFSIQRIENSKGTRINIEVPFNPVS